MIKSIYKITNLINNKVYIGQSNNPERRFKQHCCNCEFSIISLSIKKYGKNNFSLKIIEKDIQNFNEREKFWIQYYSSNNREFGYNITDGGENPPISKGEKNSLSKYSNKCIELIQKELINNDKTFQEISMDYNITVEYLSALNRGFARKNENFNYPLRENGNEIIDKDIICIIIKDLIYSQCSIEEISKKRKISPSTIYDINNGTHINCLKSIKYPIREKYSRYSNYILSFIKKELKDKNYKMSQIEIMFNVSKSTLSRINNGIKFKDNKYSYPIRSSSDRVYNPVETIPSEIGSRVAIDTQFETAFSNLIE